VVIEVTIAQWRTKPGKGGEAQNPPSLKEVDLAALEKSGELRVKEQIRLTTLDQQKAFFQRGESVPVITGMNAPSRVGGTFSQRTVNYR
jgi:type II secretory pathway component GspD/PulD (secretin)